MYSSATEDDLAGGSSAVAMDDIEVAGVRKHRRKLKDCSFNIVYKLFDRESHSRPRRWVHNTTHKYYTNVVPNRTIKHVDKQPLYYRRFSPDGRYLFGFSLCQTDIVLCEYLGVSALNDLLRKSHHGSVDSNDCRRKPRASFTETRIPGEFQIQRKNADLCASAFNLLFRKGQVVPVCYESGHLLNREFSLFTSDGQFLILASQLRLPESETPPILQIYRSNESLRINHEFDDVTLYCVRLADGVRTDTYTFKCDRMTLPHNSAVSLVGRTLAVLSHQHQCITMLELDEYGTFQRTQTIGRFLSDGDERFFENTQLRSYRNSVGLNVQNEPSRPFCEESYTCLRQCILSHLYRLALHMSQQEGSNRPVHRFYSFLNYVNSLKLWRMQLLDSDTLLLRLASSDTIMKHTTASQTRSPELMVHYQISTSTVLAVHESIDQEFLRVYEQCIDEYRNIPSYAPLFRHHSSASSSFYNQCSYVRAREAIRVSKTGGDVETARRVLNSLPITSQSFSTSAYLDCELFSFDDKYVSHMERPKQTNDSYTVKFFHRCTGTFAFELQYDKPEVSAKHNVGNLFHPFDPLVLTVQRRVPQNDFTMHIHVRCTCGVCDACVD